MDGGPCGRMHMGERAGCDGLAPEGALAVGALARRPRPASGAGPERFRRGVMGSGRGFCDGGGGQLAGATRQSIQMLGGRVRVTRDGARRAGWGGAVADCVHMRAGAETPALQVPEQRRAAAARCSPQLTPSRGARGCGVGVRGGGGWVRVRGWRRGCSRATSAGAGASRGWRGGSGR